MMLLILPKSYHFKSSSLIIKYNDTFEMYFWLVSCLHTRFPLELLYK